MTPKTGTPISASTAPSYFRGAIQLVTGRDPSPDADHVIGLGDRQRSAVVARAREVYCTHAGLQHVMRPAPRARLVDRLAGAVNHLGRLGTLQDDVDPWSGRSLAESLTDSARMLRVVADAERRRGDHPFLDGRVIAGDERTAELQGAALDIVSVYARGGRGRRWLQDELWQRWIEHVDDGWAVEAIRSLPMPWWCR